MMWSEKLDDSLEIQHSRIKLRNASRNLNEKGAKIQRKKGFFFLMTGKITCVWGAISKERIVQNHVWLNFQQRSKRNFQI